MSSGHWTTADCSWNYPEQPELVFIISTTTAPLLLQGEGALMRSGKSRKPHLAQGYKMGAPQQLKDTIAASRTDAIYAIWHLRGDQTTSTIISELQADLLAWHRPKVASSASFLLALTVTLEQIILNLVRLCAGSGPHSLAMPVRRSFYSENRHFLGDAITHNAVIRCRDFLDQRGLVLIHSGRSSPSSDSRKPSTLTLTDLGRLTLCRDDASAASVKQKAVHLIRVKTSKDHGGKRKLVAFDESEATQSMRANLERMNDLLDRTTVSLDLAESQWADLHAHLARRALAESDEAILLRAELKGFHYRVFNNGGFEDGGRIYGGDHQNVPRDFRPFIRINGDPTVEVDFKAFHPTMLYAALGIQLLPGYDPYDMGDGHREITKKTFNALLNAGSCAIRPLGEFDEQQMGLSWRDWVRKVKVHMGPLRPFLGSGCGIKLQRKDSDIAERIIMHFVDRDIPILPIHDSFIVAESHEEHLVEVMQSAFREATGFTCSVEVKRATSEQAGYAMAA